MATLTRRLVIGFVVATVALVGLAPGIASASKPKAAKPTITGLTASPTLVTSANGAVTVTATVANSTSCTLSSSPSVAGLPSTFTCTGSVQRTVTVPKNTGRKALRYKLTLSASGNGHTKITHTKIKVAAGAGASAGGGSTTAPSAATQIVGGYDGYCAVLGSGDVACWGYGLFGELGDGLGQNSATPVTVKGPGGVGTLSGVANLASDGDSMCAVLTSGGVDCWGQNDAGQLGDGAYDNSSVPEQVKGVDGIGLLTGVKRLTSTVEVNDSSYCALMVSGDVDCWGWGPNGELGDGVYYTTGSESSDVPVSVVGTGGTGTLTGVVSVVVDDLQYNNAYCALLGSGGVDCWGVGTGGELGNGVDYGAPHSGSATPVAVKGIEGAGNLGGVTMLNAGSGNFCAVLDTGGVGCWGADYLGNGTESGSPTPTAVEGPGGRGTLTGVSGLESGLNSHCAILASTGVDCWGTTPYPVPVTGIGGTGTLTGATGVVGSSNTTFCAVLGSGGAACQGGGDSGQLGNGSLVVSSFPVAVDGIGGTGTISGVIGIVTARWDFYDSFCALLSSGDVTCWGADTNGEAGNGSVVEFSAVPVPVSLP